MLTPGGEMIVYGALSTHRQTEPDKLTIPLLARSVIYETKIVRGSGSTAGSPPRLGSRSAPRSSRPSSWSPADHPDPGRAADEAGTVRRRCALGRGTCPRGQATVRARRLRSPPGPSRAHRPAIAAALRLSPETRPARWCLRQPPVPAAPARRFRARSGTRWTGPAQHRAGCEPTATARTARTRAAGPPP